MKRRTSRARASMSQVSRAGILAAYGDGVTVICELAAQFTDAAWLAATPSADWRAVDLAGHLRCVADDYNEYLDDAPASRLARLMATDAPADSLTGWDDDDPWHFLLTASGRDPDWAQPFDGTPE